MVDPAGSAGSGRGRRGLVVDAVSLINRVLKDLEKRHAPDVSDAGRLPPQVKAAAGRRPGRLPRYTWVLGLALILVALGWWWSEREDVPGKTVQAPAQPTRPAAQSADPAVPDPSAATSAVLPAPVASAPEQPPGPAPGEPATPAPAPPATSGDADPAAITPPAVEAPAPAPRDPPAAARPVPDMPEYEAQDEAGPAPGRIDKQVRPLDAAERAEQEFRRGMELFRGGRTDEAEAAWRSALEIDPAAAAPRQALLGALLERGERERAEKLLQEGLRVNPRQPKQIMLLARLQLDRGAQSEALRTLEQGLPHAQWNAEYLSMTAAVMSRVGRHRDAAELYASALRIAPGNGVWEMGRGMALRADGQRAQALAAFQRASQMQGLSPDLRAFVERQIRELQ